jgi:predicted permease
MGLGRLRRSALTRELEDELAFHLDARTEQLVRAGFSRNDAERQARAQYGELAKAERDIRRFAQRRHVRTSTAHFFETMLNDLRFALRTMLRQPGWVVVAVLALALGIGANTAVFSVINDLLIDPLRYPQSDRLVLISRENAKSGIRITPTRHQIEAWTGARSIDAIEGTASDNTTLSGEGDPRTVHQTYVTASFFQFTGARMVLGRPFRPEEAAGDGAPVVILAESFWRAHFGASPAVLGKVLTLDDKRYTVIGVLADGVRVPSFGNEQTDLWRPFVKSVPFVSGLPVARLRPGVSAAAAQSELQRLADERNRADGAAIGAEFTIKLARPGATGSMRNSVLLLGGAVVMLLLIACANVAHLLIARGAAREREIAVRAALGAGRGRIVRQLVTESLVLAAIGCVAGLVVGYFGVRLIIAMRPETMGDLANVRIDGRVVLLTVATSVITGIVFGLFSAFGSARGQFTALRAAGDASTNRRRHRVRSLLVVSEMALSVMLLVGATLLIRTMINLYHVNPGFDAAGLYAVEIHLPESRYPKPENRQAYVTRFVERVRQIPELRDFTVASAAPTQGGVIIGDWEVEGRSTPTDTKSNGSFTFFTAVRPGYFELLRMPLLFGRGFTDASVKNSEQVINAALARQLWGNTDVVGRRFRMARKRTATEQAQWNVVAGVVDDAATLGLAADRDRPFIYQPTQFGDSWDGLTFMARVRGAFPAAAVRKIQLDLDPAIPPSTPVAVSDMLIKTIATQRFMMTLLTVFAGIAISLSAIGLYGVVAYMVNQRTREIGIRIALGATTSDIRQLVLSRGALLAAAGLALGLAGAFAGTRALRETLYGVAPSDPVSFAIGALALLAIALAACTAPARRAARVDPAVAMRAD